MTTAELYEVVEKARVWLSGNAIQSRLEFPPCARAEIEEQLSMLDAIRAQAPRVNDRPVADVETVLASVPPLRRAVFILRGVFRRRRASKDIEALAGNCTGSSSRCPRWTVLRDEIAAPVGARS